MSVPLDKSTSGGTKRRSIGIWGIAVNVGVGAGAVRVEMWHLGKKNGELRWRMSVVLWLSRDMNGERVGRITDGYAMDGIKERSEAPKHRS